MKKIKYSKTKRSKLRNSEHGLGNKAVKEALDAKVAATNDPVLIALAQKFGPKVQKEEEMLKSIWASERTPRMEYINRERSFAMSIVCRVIENAADSAFESDRQAAGLKLRPITHAYKGMTSETRAGETDDLFNIQEDFGAPENATALDTLFLTPFVTRAATLNQQYYELLGERELEWQHTHHGSLAPIRLETDAILYDITEAINLHYDILPSPALEALIDAMNAALQPFYRLIARRHKHAASSSPDGDGGSDDGDDDGDGEDIDEETQAPDTTLPEAPETPPQNPVATPPAINPEDLNPPAAGE